MSRLPDGRGSGSSPLPPGRTGAGPRLPEDEGRRGVMALLRPFMAGRWPSLLLAAGLSCITVIAGVALLSVAGWFLTGAFLATAASAFNLFVPSALVRALAFLRIGARYLERLTGHAATLAFLADVRVALFASLARLQPAQLARYRDGDLVARLVGDIDALDAVFLSFLLPWISVLLAGLAFGLWAVWLLPTAYAWWLLCVLILMTAVLPAWVVRRSLEDGERLRRQSSLTRSQLHDIVSRHADVVVFAMQPAARNHFRKAGDVLESSRDRLAAHGSFGALLQQCSAALLLGALLWGGMEVYLRESISAPLWVALILGALGLFEAGAMLVRGVSRLGAGAAAASRVGAVLRQAPDAEQAPQPRALPMQGELALSGVCLRYDRPALEISGGDDPWPAAVAAEDEAEARESPPVLRDVSLHVGQGERIALVGDSGSGKSSLLAVIMRIVAPQAGNVRYGGIDLAEVDPAVLYQRFALLSQDSPVFLGTIRQNLKIGGPHASDAQLWDALEQAGLDAFVQSLDDGLDAWVGEAGRTLSVGQARRLCLARLLLTDAQVWLLDEPTAGLDREAQLAFFRDLARVAGKRTVILATHADVPEGVVSRTVRIGLDGRLGDA
ncbi:thiol reductant ABC exporter subunit CydC [Paracandidimonas soli]|uniref:ATP-binding cassette subfamily C protein CydC n=1 Tax=Paracandidimonas soli TaxID=1917182 RepID=A0A4R3VGA3_9BURK|nr:thiol reductant ABC exporter subunit CydC [Paracandidimonas soli]TCV03053.1 ATP-binding cassette subfamily C protein CydC [Paracandidimonas soli]